MNTAATQTPLAPPNLIASLLSGFDAITNHIGLILFPIALDVFLWLGPHLRLETMIKDILAQLNTLAGMNSQENQQMLSLLQEFWLLVAQRMNLFTMLRSYPVGVSSLMVSRLPVETPFFTPQMLDITSFWGVAGVWLALTLAGLLVGSFYYLLVAQASLTGRVDLRAALAQWGWSSRQVVLLALLMGLVFIAIAIPGSCFLSAISLSGLSLGGLSVLLYAALMAWLLFPLLFSAHGIFTYQQTAWKAVRHSATLTRMTLVRTSLLFITILLINEGLDTLWRVPPENSWFSLVGIAGHAFISTSLLAASFVYFRDATRWIQRLAQQSVMIGPEKNLKNA